MLSINRLQRTVSKALAKSKNIACTFSSIQYVCKRFPWKTLPMHPAFQYNFWSHTVHRWQSIFFKEWNYLLFSTFLYYLSYIWKQANIGLKWVNSVLSLFLKIGLVTLFLNIVGNIPEVNIRLIIYTLKEYCTTINVLMIFRCSTIKPPQPAPNRTLSSFIVFKMPLSWILLKEKMLVMGEEEEQLYFFTIP